MNHRPSVNEHFMNEKKYLAIHCNTSCRRTVRTGAVCLLALMATLAAGCSGINASKSVSPLDFLLPGLHIQNRPPPPAIPSETNTIPLVAQATTVRL